METGTVAGVGACPACGAPGRPGDLFCTRCGARLVPHVPVPVAPTPAVPAASSAPAVAPPAAGTEAPRLRRPGVAALLSANLPGLGQVYNGQWIRGLVSMLVAILLLGFGLYLPFAALFASTEKARKLLTGLLILAALGVHIAFSARQAWLFAQAHPVRTPLEAEGNGAAAALVAVIALELAGLVAVNGALLLLVIS